MQYGLHSDHGVLTLSGKPFYGMGLNSFISFVAQMNPDDAEYERKKNIYREDIGLCAELGIPFMRIPFCTWGEEGFRAWMKDPESYFEKMDLIVREAERCRVGIVVSLLWRFCTMCLIAGEPMKTMADPESRQVSLSVRYVKDVVSRYKDSPAVWGWEIGNEYNLDGDWGPSHFPDTPQFTYSSADYAAFFRIIGETIRSIDPYRMITSGNGEQRNAAWHLFRGYSEGADWKADFTPDTLGQFEEMMLLQNADPIDTVCTHFQHGNRDNLLDGFAAAEGEKATPISVKDFLKLHVDTAKKHGKALYFGECGDMMQWHELGRHYLNEPELLHRNFGIVMQSILDAGVQLASAWMEGTINGIRYEVIEDHNDGKKYGYFKLLAFEKMNRDYREQGLQETAEYWAEAENKNA